MNQPYDVEKNFTLLELILGGMNMRLSTYDRFQAGLRAPIFLEINKECKTLLELIEALEKHCNIKSPSGSPWVEDLISQAKRIRVTRRK